VGEAGSPACQNVTVDQFCCPAESVCGDHCCDTVKEMCDQAQGKCVCRPENQCGSLCCDPTNPDCECDQELGVCGTGNCPSGAGSFLRVRSVR
jgi:hypothetical protein